MATRRKVKVDTSRIRPRVDTYDRLQVGDVVKLTREQGDFKVLGFVMAGDWGSLLWVDLHGGTANREQLRSVTWDRLKIPSDRQLARQRKVRAA